MQNTLNAMASQCPDSIIVAGGYSQGAAVSHRAIESLDPAVKNQIAGVILYGDTQKQQVSYIAFFSMGLPDFRYRTVLTSGQQDNNQIPNFPQDKTKIICQRGDLVCVGTLTITPAHLTYGARADEGAAFLAQQIQGAQAAKKAKRALEEKAKRAAMGLAA